MAYYLESNLQCVTSPFLYFPVSHPVPPHAVASTKCLAGCGSLVFLLSRARQGGDLGSSVGTLVISSLKTYCYFYMIYLMDLEQGQERGLVQEQG